MNKYISLSFDDGPNPAGDNTMNNMLDVLERHKVKASFFLIGNKINEDNAAVIRRAVSLGCDIENHSWSHPFMADLSVDEINEEYDRCDEAIIKITGTKPSFFRPPYISTSDRLFETIKVPFICGHGVEDWVPEVNAEQRYSRMMEARQDGLIYLLHVMEGNEATIQAVDRIIPELKKEGYIFVTVPEMFRIKNVSPVKEKTLWTLVK